MLCHVTQLLIGVAFEFVNFDSIIILVVFRLANTLEYMYISTRPQHNP